MATIERIDLYNINQNSRYNHTASTVIKNFDSKKHRILLRVDNIIYDVLDRFTSKNIYIPIDKKKGLQPPLGFGQPKLKTVTIYAQLYDYQNDIILDTKKQDFTESFFFGMYTRTGALTTTLANTFTTYWNKTRRVEKVEGPFTTAECKTLATEIKADTRYYFAATSKQFLNETELLLMKWQYRYDDGEFTDFNHAVETQNVLQNVMSCVFHKNLSKIQIYAFFKKPSDTVSVVLDMETGKIEETEEKKNQEESHNKQTNSNDTVLAEAKVKAFIRMLRVKEGTDSNRGYRKLFGNDDFTKPPHNKSMKTHPEIYIPYGDTSSSAAGAYQIMYFTFRNLSGYFEDKKKKKWIYLEEKDYVKKYNIKSFDEESQDKLCLSILKHGYTYDRPKIFYNPSSVKKRNWRKRFKGQQGDIIQMIIDDDIKRAALLSSLCWSSLPDSPYGQQSTGYTFKDVKEIYDKYLKEELEENQSFKTYLKPGFLKEFGYIFEKTEQPSNKETANENTTACKEDFSQCHNYADVWENPEISNDNGGKNNNRYGYNSRRGHKGIDILTGSNYKEVHSLMCGEVVSLVKRFKTNEYKEHSLGNTLMIKSKSKEGKEVYILYCHLDKIYVKKNQKVKHGEKIALSGSTGNASDGSLPNGKKGRGIKKENWHCHIEAATKGGENHNNFYYLGDYRIKAEDYMKTKFDKNGNAIKNKK